MQEYILQYIYRQDVPNPRNKPAVIHVLIQTNSVSEAIQLGYETPEVRQSSNYQFNVIIGEKDADTRVEDLVLRNQEPDYIYDEHFQAMHCRYNRAGKCQLKQQFKLRKLNRESWYPKFDENSFDLEMRCTFLELSRTHLMQASCPVFTFRKVEGQKVYITKKLPQSFNGNRRFVLSGEKLYKGNVFFERTAFGRNDADLYFCAQEGMIHPSYCAVCTEYQGDSMTASYPAEKKHPDACRYSCFVIGTIESDRLLFIDQYDFDRTLEARFLCSTEFESNYFPLPVPSRKIKHANQTDIKDYDFLRVSLRYCTRCGPRLSGSIRLSCWSGCGTRALCENCIEQAHRRKISEGKYSLSFICPDCHRKSEVILNPNDIDLYKNGKTGPLLNFLNIPLNPFIEVDYYNLLDAINSSSRHGDRFRTGVQDSIDIKSFIANEKIDRDLVFSRAPEISKPKMTVLWQGLMRGLYWYSLQDKKAFLFKPAITVSQPLPNWLHAGGFEFDCVISYATEDTELALELQHELLHENISTFLIHVEKNKDDILWSVRFREAMFYSRYFLPIISSAYLERAGTALEFYEALKICISHKKEDHTCLHPIIPVLLDKTHLSRIQQKSLPWLRPDDLPFNREEEGKIQHKFDKSAFYWSLIPFSIQYDRLGLKRIVRFIALINLASKAGFDNFEYLPEMHNSFRGIVRDNVQANHVLVFLSAFDDTKVCLVRRTEANSPLEFVELVDKAMIDFEVMSLDEAILVLRSE